MTYQATSIVPIVIALVEIVKRAGVPAKLCPLVAIILGIAGAFIMDYNGGTAKTIVSGIIYGLSAAGLYSGVKVAVAKKPKVASTETNQ